MGRIGAPEIIFIVLAIVVLFGAKKLPEIGQSIGKAIKEFKKAGRDIEDDVKEITNAHFKKMQDKQTKLEDRIEELQKKLDDSEKN